MKIIDYTVLSLVNRMSIFKFSNIQQQVLPFHLVTNTSFDDSDHLQGCYDCSLTTITIIFLAVITHKISFYEERYLSIWI